MKKLLLLLLCVPLIGVGQTESITKRVSFDDDKLTYKGTFHPIYYYESELYTGILFEKYENDQLQYEMNFKDGNLHGLSKWYHENGQIMFERNYIDGKEEGLWKLYYETGQLEQEGNYKDDKRDGLWKIYYKNGQENWVGNRKDGKTYGVWKRYYENGNLMIEEQHKDGELISSICFDEQGNEIDCE
jgi:antitoxin component YwqK of YwqJK toxin-antitoxin module